jgi:hypothetical protein
MHTQLLKAAFISGIEGCRTQLVDELPDGKDNIITIVDRQTEGVTGAVACESFTPVSWARFKDSHTTRLQAAGWDNPPYLLLIMRRDTG